MVKRGATLTYLPEAADAIYAAPEMEANAVGGEGTTADEEKEEMPLY